MGRTFGMDKPPAVRPFDIRDYAAALIQLNEVVTNVHQLSLNADQLTRSAGWQKALKDMTDATDRRVDRVFSRLCLLLGLAFVLAIVYRILSTRLRRSVAHSAGEKP